MVNVDKLRGKIVEKRMSAKSVANAIGIDAATFYRKMNTNGDGFSIKEADMISEVLSLSLDEVNAIFFSQYVA